MNGQRGAKLLTRVLGKVIRILTGVEIHPAAVLGTGVFIDHATGVVIGETAVVGNDVTIEGGVKVLGTTMIGEGSQIGANSVVVKTVPPGSVVVGVPGQIIGQPAGGRPRPIKPTCPTHSVSACAHC